MNSHVIVAFILGLVLGAVLVAWFCHAYLVSRFTSLETLLHDRLSTFETNIAAHFRRNPAPAAAAAPGASAPGAAPAAASPAPASQA